MTRRATFHIAVTGLLVLLLAAAACSSGEEEGDAATEFGNRGAATLPTAEAKDLAALSKVIEMGESFDMDGSVLPGPMGEPPLSGVVKMQVDLDRAGRQAAGGDGAETGRGVHGRVQGGAVCLQARRILRRQLHGYQRYRWAAQARRPHQQQLHPGGRNRPGVGLP